MNLKHGHYRNQKTDPTFMSWCGMLRRCDIEKCEDFKNYGGRGIKVCERWRVFENFLKDMGQRPIGMTLDRIDNEAHYEPGNCRWLSRAEQNKNRRCIPYVTYQGETKTRTEWARGLGITSRALRYRLRRWPIDIAISKGKT